MQVIVGGIFAIIFLAAVVTSAGIVIFFLLPYLVLAFVSFLAVLCMAWLARWLLRRFWRR